MAASSFRGLRKLDEIALKNIVIFKPPYAKELLAKELGIPPFSDPKDVQKAPFITYIYDNIVFAADKGFPWDHISLVVEAAHSFLKRILGEDHKLSDAIRDYKEVAKILEPLNDRHKQQYTDFIFETVLCHYNLYRYVFSHLRDVVHPHVKKEVNVPSIPPRLKEGKSVNIWEYEEKIKAISQKEKIDREEQEKKMESIKESLTEHKTIESLNEEPFPYSKMALTDLVKDVLKGFTEKTEKELSVHLEGTAKSLEHKLEKTALPRPAVLGSPPRFKPKSPIGLQVPGTSTNKGNKSPKPKSGRGSAASVASKK